MGGVMSSYIVNIELANIDAIDEAIEAYDEDTNSTCPDSVLLPPIEGMITDFLECFSIRVGEPESAYIRVTEDKAVPLENLSDYLDKEAIPFTDLVFILHLVMPEDIMMAYDYDLIKVSQCYEDTFTVVGPTEDGGYSKQSYNSGEFDTGFESHGEGGLDAYNQACLEKSWPRLNIQNFNVLNRLIQN